jgi:dTDP-4-dehydrorhamnose 3,5-epimerase
VSEWQTTPIPGVLRDSVHVAEDRRGSFSELWRASRWDTVVEGSFVQSNLSRSTTGVLRGMHFHRRQADLWILAEGRATVAVCDLRPMLSGDNTSPVALTFEMTRGEAVLIPEGVAHGFYAPEPMALVYFVTNEYDGTDELGFMWNDPLAAIAWPVSDPVLSDRDAANPTLEAAVSSLMHGT